MDMTIVIIFGVSLIGSLAAVFLYLQFFGDDAGARDQMSSIVSSQRADTMQGGVEQKRSLFKTAQESGKVKRKSSKLTLEKKLKYARWKMPPIVYRMLVVSFSLIGFSLTTSTFNIVIQMIALFTTGPLIMGTLLTRAIEKRFKAFDADYPAMLLSLVGLLKTGMNAMGALDAAAEGLDEASLVRKEIELMSARLRYGVSEDRSIGSFGDDIYHEEIELFVQALLLSRRVGGNLSDTLDRLAKQVRKRQYFRNSAKAAVGMQRGSIWFILGIMFALEAYIYVMQPRMVTGAWEHEVGWQVWQTGIIIICLGVWWVRQVTKIRV